MAKKRKTRKQKIASGMRRQHTVTEPVSPEATPASENLEHFTATTSTTSRPRPSLDNAISTIHYQYLPSDLLKTASLTGVIILAELLLFFVFRR